MQITFNFFFSTHLLRPPRKGAPHFGNHCNSRIFTTFIWEQPVTDSLLEIIKIRSDEEQF
jgi:hypothetical protein